MFTAGLSNGPGKSWQLCYLNSVIQALCPILYKWSYNILNMSIRKLKKAKITKEAFALALLCDEMIQSRDSQSPVDSRNLLKVLDSDPKEKKFPIGYQHDAHDFLCFLLDKINHKPLNDYFTVTERKAIQCIKCGHTLYENEKENSSRLESYQKCLYLDFYTLKCDDKKNKKKEISIDELLDRFSDPEEIEYKCSYDQKHGCKEGKPGKAISNVRIIGPLTGGLILYLGRSLKNTKKILTRISLKEFQSFIYYDKDPNKPVQQVTKKLDSILVHLGTTNDRGHFITFVKHPIQDYWILYDDEYRRIVSWQYIEKYSDSYSMLYYK